MEAYVTENILFGRDFQHYYSCPWQPVWVVLQHCDAKGILVILEPSGSLGNVHFYHKPPAPALTDA